MYTEKAIRLLDFEEKRDSLEEDVRLYVNGGQLELRLGDVKTGRILFDRSEDDQPKGWGRTVKLLDLIRTFEKGVLEMAREIRKEKDDAEK